MIESRIPARHSRQRKIDVDPSRLIEVDTSAAGSSRSI